MRLAFSKRFSTLKLLYAHFQMGRGDLRLPNQSCWAFNHAQTRVPPLYPIMSLLWLAVKQRIDYQIVVFFTDFAVLVFKGHFKTNKTAAERGGDRKHCVRPRSCLGCVDSNQRKGVLQSVWPQSPHRYWDILTKEGMSSSVLLARPLSPFI